MCLFIITTFGQKARTYGNVSFQKGNLQQYIGSFLTNKITAAMDTLCIQSCSMIYFLVDKDGNVDSVCCNRGTPRDLVNLFTEAIYSTKGQWISANNVTGKSQKFILPVCYQFGERNCVVNQGCFDSMFNLLAFSGKDKSNNTVYYLTGLEYVDCILLGTMYFRGMIE